MNAPEKIGILGDVFALSWGGTTLIVEEWNGDFPSNAFIRVGSFEAKVENIDIPRVSGNRDQRAVVGVFISREVKEQLLPLRGRDVEVWNRP